MKKKWKVKAKLNERYGIMTSINIGNQTAYKNRRYNKFAEKIYKMLRILNADLSISEQKFKDRKDYLYYVFYPKWVLGECHHLCCFCNYKNECFSNIESEN